MSAISRDEVAHLAHLARIDLDDAELDRLAGQLDVIVDAVASVSEAADARDADVPATSHPLPLTNVTRPDEVRPSLDPEAVLAGAPEAEQQRFRVPRILQDEL